MSPAEKKRISFRIRIPSVSFSQFLRKVIFDKNVFLLFTENPGGMMQANGIKLDASVSEDILVRLKFAIIRARNFVVKERVGADKFEEIFGRYEDIFAVREDSSICVESETKIEPLVLTSPQVTAEPDQSFAGKFLGRVEYSEKSAESNRGSSTDWNKQDAVSDSHSDHWSTTTFEGKEISHISDRFIRTPLLDAITLSRLITEFHIRLKEFGSY